MGPGVASGGVGMDWKLKRSACRDADEDRDGPAHHNSIDLSHFA
jgi:hypothetical protein